MCTAHRHLLARERSTIDHIAVHGHIFWIDVRCTFFKNINACSGINFNTKFFVVIESSLFFYLVSPLCGYVRMFPRKQNVYTILILFSMSSSFCWIIFFVFFLLSFIFVHVDTCEKHKNLKEENKKIQSPIFIQHSIQSTRNRMKYMDHRPFNLSHVSGINNKKIHTSNQILGSAHLKL